MLENLIKEINLKLKLKWKYARVFLTFIILILLIYQLDIILYISFSFSVLNEEDPKLEKGEVLMIFKHVRFSSTLNVSDFVQRKSFANLAVKTLIWYFIFFPMIWVFHCTNQCQCTFLFSTPFLARGYLSSLSHASSSIW